MELHGGAKRPGPRVLLDALRRAPGVVRAVAEVEGVSVRQLIWNYVSALAHHRQPGFEHPIEDLRHKACEMVQAGTDEADAVAQLVQQADSSGELAEAAAFTAIPVDEHWGIDYVDERAVQLLEAAAGGQRQPPEPGPRLAHGLALQRHLQRIEEQDAFAELTIIVAGLADLAGQAELGGFSSDPIAPGFLSDVAREHLAPGRAAALEVYLQISAAVREEFSRYQDAGHDPLPSIAFLIATNHLFALSGFDLQQGDGD